MIIAVKYTYNSIEVLDVYANVILDKGRDCQSKFVTQIKPEEVHRPLNLPMVGQQTYDLVCDQHNHKELHEFY